MIGCLIGFVDENAGANVMIHFVSALGHRRHMCGERMTAWTSHTLKSNNCVFRFGTIQIVHGVVVEHVPLHVSAATAKMKVTRHLTQIPQIIGK